MDNTNKRFWVLDELIKIGHLEAAMSHGDEQICNIDHDIENSGGDIKVVEELAKEQDYHREGISLDYENRVGCENDIMETLGGNSKDWCYLKHRATAFVIAAENYHARGCCPSEEHSLILAAKSLALTASHCFGFEVMDCLRCLGDKLNTQYEVELELAKDRVFVRPLDPSEITVTEANDSEPTKSTPKPKKAAK